MSGKACDGCGAVCVKWPWTEASDGTIKCSNCIRLDALERRVQLVDQDLGQRLQSLQLQLANAVEMAKRLHEQHNLFDARIKQLEDDTKYMTRIGRPE